MKMLSVLQTTFTTSKPLTDAPMNSSVAPVVAVYRNGVLAAPATAPVVANLAVGLYSLTHTFSVANGYAPGDWVTITAQVVLDGITVVMPVWEGNLYQDSADVSLVLGNNIYPMFTTHSPSTGANQAPDGGAVPTVTVRRNLAVTAIVPVLANPATGVYIVTLPLTAAAGWAMGDEIDLIGACTIDGIAGQDCFFSGGNLVTGVGGGGTPHHEVTGHPLRST